MLRGFLKSGHGPALSAAFLLPVMLGVLRQATGGRAAGFFGLSLAGACALALLPMLGGKKAALMPSARAPEGLLEAESGG